MMGVHVRVNQVSPASNRSARFNCEIHDYGLIDPPSPYGPRKAWQAFLAELARLPQDDPDVRRETREAQEHMKSAKD
jgi:hypothetical protein